MKVILNAFAAFSVYKTVLKSVSYVFFSETIISAPCLRSVKGLKILFLLLAASSTFYQLEKLKKCWFSFLHSLLLFNPEFFANIQFEGELYLVATDQGYINQPDLVWEKLNEVKHYFYMMIFFIQITLKYYCFMLFSFYVYIGGSFVYLFIKM